MARAGRECAALACALAMAGVAAPAPVAAAPPPQIRTTDGQDELALVGSGQRSMLYVVGLYEVALYLPSGFAATAVWERDIPVTFRVRVLYGGDMPSQIPSGWREELVPALTDAQMQTLTEAFRDLGSGDVVWVRYRPGRGTRIAVDQHQVLHDSGTKMIEAFVEQWMGRDAVSEDIREQLLED